MIQFNDVDNVFANNTELDFTDTSHYLNNIINGNLNFKDPSINQFNIGQNNEGINKALNIVISVNNTIGEICSV